MKKTLATIITMILCAVIAITGISAETAYAAGNTSLKVTFNKKSVKLSINEENKGIEKPDINALTNAWGNPSVSENEWTSDYIWKKGKTEIIYTDIPSEPMYSNISMDIKDKNAEICGLKVGMKKAKAVKILKKFGKEINIDNNVITIQIIEKGRIQINCTLKKGKISQITGFIYCRYTE